MLAQTSSVGIVKVEMAAQTPWAVSCEVSSEGPGLEVLELKLEAPSPLPPPQLELSFAIPQKGVHFRWSPDGRNGLPMRHESADFRINSWLPACELFDVEGMNTLSFALSETVRTVAICCGADIVGGDCVISSSIKLFKEPEEPLSSYRLLLRFDRREISFADAVSSIVDWHAGIPGLAPMKAPAAAFEPFYSSWYSYFGNPDSKAMEEECALSKDYGLGSLLVDDGWHTDQKTDTYGAAGDWAASPLKFPGMREHVKRVHALGMKYLPWIGTPIAGEKSRAAKLFKGKTLRTRGDFSILDPRFPEVRESLAARLEEAMRAWDLDGFKLDYIEWFSIEGEDPALKDGYAGRDFKSVPLAVDELLSSIAKRLQAIKPDVMIEFRQAYMGPSARKYANIIRVGDCPANIRSNRVGTINLRLSSAGTAVHSDMLTWSLSDTPESAALQLLSSLFAVPQISMRLSKLPEGHRRMLRFWLSFMAEHRETLQRGRFVPLHPEMDYPVAFAETAKERIVVVYCEGMLADLDGAPGKACYLANATGKGSLPLLLKCKPLSYEVYNALGERLPSQAPEPGLSMASVPPSGLLVARF